MKLNSTTRPGVKKGRTRQPSPFPKPSAGDWPQQWEEVDLFWARCALRWGNAHVLARHLREAEEVDPSLLKSIARMLGPNTAGQQSLRLEFRYRGRGRPAEKRPRVPSCPAELADLLDPPPDRRWELTFVGRKGSPGVPDQYWHEHQIYMKLRFALVSMGKLEAAVERVREETGFSRSKIFNAWMANKPVKTD